MPDGRSAGGSKVCIVTGATSGIGRVTAHELAAMGHSVTLVARDRARGEAVRSEISRSTGSHAVRLAVCDLASQAQVRGLARELLESNGAIHVLVNNAGLTLGRRTLTEEGIETTFAVNHLAPFLLTALLRERLVDSAPARVVTVASNAHRRGAIDFDDLSAERGYSGLAVYGRSKLANILFTFELARRLRGAGVTANCLHPGVVHTGFGRTGPLHVRLFFKIAGRLLLTPERGADTVIWLAASPDVEGETGGYFVDRRRVEPSRAARDRAAAERLWRVSARMVGLPEDESVR